MLTSAFVVCAVCTLVVLAQVSGQNGAGHPVQCIVLVSCAVAVALAVVFVLCGGVGARDVCGRVGGVAVGDDHPGLCVVVV